MADVKISDLPTSTTPLDGSEIIPVVQHGLTKMTTISAVRDGLALASDLTTHESDTANPHAVTAAQVGLGNVDNTSDADKPVSTAAQTALDTKVSKTGDTMSGPLVVPAGAAGGQVPQAQEIGDLAVAQRTDIYIKSNIVGTVSQVAGVPTGAIVEQGNNANGLYIRLASGFQLCWANQPSLTVPGSVNLAISWTYPAAFAGSVQAQANWMSGNTGDIRGGIESASNTSAIGYLFNSSATDRVGTVAFFAVGRWF